MCTRKSLGRTFTREIVKIDYNLEKQCLRTSGGQFDGPGVKVLTKSVTLCDSVDSLDAVRPLQENFMDARDASEESENCRDCLAPSGLG